MLLFLLIPFGAFFVDMDRLYISRGEVQTAADSAAQVGAAALWPPVNGRPNWAAAVAAAQAALSNNKVRGVPVTSADLPTANSGFGYWTLASGANGWDSSTPSDSLAPPSTDVPAIQVTIPIGTSAGGGTVNGGPIHSMFSGLIGFVGGPTSTPVKAAAISMSAPSQSAGPGTLAPYAVSKCVFDQYWDSAKREPVKNCGSPSVYPPGPGNVGSQYCAFQIGALNQCTSSATCQCGQLLEASPSSGLKIYDPANPSDPAGKVTMANGDKTHFFNDGTFPTDGDIMIPVIDEASCTGGSGHPLNGSTCNIYAFACLHVDHNGKDGDCIPDNKGNLPALLHSPSNVAESVFIDPDNNMKNKCLIVYFNFAKACSLPGGTVGGGPYFGTVTPPRLVQ